MSSAQDTAFRQLFAHPEIIRDLLTAFAPEGWVEQLDLATLERVNGSFVTGDGSQRHSDMVWKVRHRSACLPLYILLEFQSVPDPWMALRMHVYCGLLYQDLVRRHELPAAGKLPPVLPIVLYSGTRSWHCCTTLSALLAECPEGMLELQPKQCYLLLDLARLLDSRQVMLRNLATALLGLYQRPRRHMALEVLRHIAGLAKSDDSEELRRTILAWLRTRLPGDHRTSKVLRRDREVEMEMPRVRFPVFDTFEEQFKYGDLLDGKQSILEMLLKKRFGPIPQDYMDRMELGISEDFDVWAERFVDAKTLEEVFLPDPADFDE